MCFSVAPDQQKQIIMTGELSVANICDACRHGISDPDKSEVLCIGKANSNNASFNIAVSVNKEYVKILGVYLCPNKEMCEH